MKLSNKYAFVLSFHACHSYPSSVSIYSYVPLSISIHFCSCLSILKRFCLTSAMSSYLISYLFISCHLFSSLFISSHQVQSVYLSLDLFISLHPIHLWPKRCNLLHLCSFPFLAPPLLLSLFISVRLFAPPAILNHCLFTSRHHPASPNISWHLQAFFTHPCPLLCISMPLCSSNFIFLILYTPGR
jgi:hypothetical protein